ncbi:SpvB/TcaC N-terminal domain-containing protein [Roseovarius rhodophyticola]|uniref:SpvB/TcaC N-terminal domain-containing protein n=1 Tax=Roseovarius rhodophyticola TaxID=3080827 RepID=A0ABZ2TJL6_9RHOB
MKTLRTQRSWVNKTASFVLAVSVLLSSFTHLTFASVLTNGDEGYITNTQSLGSASLSAAEVNEASGGFSYDYDFGLPAGVNGHTPTLGLSYNNQAASDMQPTGYGFSLSIPYIEQINKFGSEAMFGASSTFWSSLSGELVADGGDYVAKYEDGSFLEYTLSSNEWTTTDKSGTTYRFGSNAAAQQSDPDDSTAISRWYLSSATDTNGNVITYTYTEDTGVVYPSTISYGPYQVDFTLEAADPHTSAALGFLSERDQRIAEIELSENSTVFKRYDMAYTDGINGSRDLLSSITENSIEGE